MKAILNASTVLFITVCLFTNCKSMKKAIKNPDLSLTVSQLVSCLNSRDNDCVKQLYASDFKSFSPIVTMANSNELVDKTIENLAKNKYKIHIKIHEVKQKGDMGYVNLDWILVEPLSNGEFEVVHAEKRLDVWTKNEKNKWQLHRSLFYTERMF